MWARDGIAAWLLSVPAAGILLGCGCTTLHGRRLLQRLEAYLPSALVFVGSRVPAPSAFASARTGFPRCCLPACLLDGLTCFTPVGCRRWASENSKVPALLLPPTTMDPAAASMPAAPAVVVAGADNLAALQDAFEWTLQTVAKPGALPQGGRGGGEGTGGEGRKWGCPRLRERLRMQQQEVWALGLQQQGSTPRPRRLLLCLLCLLFLLRLQGSHQPLLARTPCSCAQTPLPVPCSCSSLAAPAGDEIYVLHAEQLATEEDGIAARKRLVKAVYEWQQSSSAPSAARVNVVCDVVLGSSSECWRG